MPKDKKRPSSTANDNDTPRRAKASGLHWKIGIPSLLAVMLGIRWNSLTASKAVEPPEKRCPIKNMVAQSGDLTRDLFRKFKGREPVLIQNLIDHWDHSAWKSKETFLDKFGDVRIRLLGHVAYNRTHFYHGGTFRQPSAREYMTQDEKVFKDHIHFSFNDHKAYQLLYPHISPMPESGLRSLLQPLWSLGRNGTGSGGHAHNQNWVAQLTGKKIWILAPPKTQWPSLVDHACDIASRKDQLPQKSIICEQHPGEVFFLPDNWYHATCNLDEFTFGVGGKGDASHWPRHFFDIQAGNTQAVREAVARGVNVGKRGGPPDNQWPLHLAVKHAPVSMIDFLLEQRADPYAFDDEGRQAIHMAAQEGTLEVLDYLLKKKIATAHDLDKAKSYNVMHYSYVSGNFEKVEYLLENYGVDINAIEHDNGATLMHHAAADGHAQKIERLLELRSDLNVMDPRGRDPLDWALGNNQVQTSDALIRLGLKHHPGRLNQAVMEGAAHTLLWLLKDKGYSANYIDERGANPLHYAASSGHIEVTKTLVKHKANVHAKDTEGKRPIDVVRGQNHAMSELLRR